MTILFRKEDEVMIETSPEMMKLSAELARVIANNSVQVIFDKIKVAKGKKNNEVLINNLEEIINQLISEKNQLIQIAQAYDEKLVAQKISNEEIEYITTSIIPLINSLLEESNGEEIEKSRQQLEVLKSLLSKEMFNILQLLGFNFKQAVGEPLTDLIKSLILSQNPTATEMNFNLRLANQQKEIEYLKLFQDEDAFNRMKEIFPVK